MVGCLSAPMGEVTSQQLTQAFDFRRKFAPELRAHLGRQRRAVFGAAVEPPEGPLYVMQRGKDRARQPPRDGDRR